jgi:hypothetical protein
MTMNRIQRMMCRIPRVRWLRVFLVGTPLVVVVVLVAVAVVQGRKVWRIQKELERIRAAGEPLTYDDVFDGYRRPEGGQDATDLWLEAFAQIGPLDDDPLAEGLPLFSSTPVEPVAPGEGWPELGQAEALLAHYQPALGLMHLASERGGAAQFPVHRGVGKVPAPAHAADVRQAARLLWLEAHVELHRGRPEAALECLHAILAASNSLEQEPLVVSHLVRLACDGLACYGVEGLLSVEGLDDTSLRELQQSLLARDYAEGLGRVMQAERVTGITAYTDPSLVDDRIRSNSTGRLVWRAWSRDDIVLYLSLMRRLVDATHRPWPEAVQAGKRVDEQVEEVVAPQYMLTALLMPALGRVFDVTARQTAKNRAAAAAIAVELYRRRRGELPESLEELVPEFLSKVPTDPFDGKPLRYLTHDVDFVIYSIGHDLTDNGGQGDERGEPDVVFRVMPPSAGVAEPTESDVETSTQSPGEP